jgi:hypothetical protein
MPTSNFDWSIARCGHKQPKLRDNSTMAAPPDKEKFSTLLRDGTANVKSHLH